MSLCAIWFKTMLFDYEKGPADFADYLISYTNKINGADPTVTFDTACKGMSHFRLIK
jgi:predicted nucleic-acid-binding protein